MGRRIHIVDTTMRDGSHAVGHSYTPQQVAQIAAGLDRAGVDLIEVSHGDGIAGSSINYGFCQTPEMELIQAVARSVKRAKPTVLLLPGIGTIEDLEQARDHGAQAVRVATHCTEADIAIQHIQYAKSRGMFVAGFLMMAHMASPETLAQQARIFEDAGADYVNLADSAGYLVPDGVKARVEAVREAIRLPVGFHAHNNLGVAVANSLAAVEAGAEYIDVTCRGLGAGAGNTQGEVFCAVLERQGYDTGVDFYQLMDTAEEIVEPILKRPQVIRNDSLMLGYAGVYSSFLLHARRAAERFGLDTRDILYELGQRKMVGGQEDMIVDVAYSLKMSRQQEAAQQPDSPG